MEILHNSEWIRFDSPIGEPNEENKAQFQTEDSYRIERKEFFQSDSPNQVIWYGLNTNWVLAKGKTQWQKLVGGDFVDCPEPIYERMYKERTTRYQYASALLSVLDTIKLNDIEIPGEETLSEAFFRKLGAYDIDLNADLEFSHLKPNTLNDLKNGK